MDRRTFVKASSGLTIGLAFGAGTAIGDEDSRNTKVSRGNEGETWKDSDSHNHDLYVEGDGSGGRVHYAMGSCLRQKGAYWEDADHTRWEPKFHFDSQMACKYRTSSDEDPSDAVSYEGIAAHEIDIWHEYGDGADCQIWVSPEDATKLGAEPHPQYTAFEAAQDVFEEVGLTALDSLSAVVGSVRQASEIYSDMKNEWDNQQIDESVYYEFDWTYGTGSAADQPDECSHYVDFKFELPDGVQRDFYVQSWVYDLFNDERLGIRWRVNVRTPSYDPRIQTTSTSSKLEMFPESVQESYNLQEISIDEANDRGLDVDEDEVLGDTVVYTPGLPIRAEIVSIDSLEG